jgi:Ca2+-binding RTX toxin-like protein
LVNVFDTGATGTDLLKTYGTDAADKFLLRASSNDFPNGVAFLAALHGNPVAQVERINYNKALEGLLLETGDGNDDVTLDDNWTLTTIRGGAGADHFQIGQIFKTLRDAAHANIAANDEFDTTHTTRGFLSNGVSFETTIEGGDDNDTFVVFRNKAVLNLFGQDGDDMFTVRAFALEGSQTSNLAGEGGDDYVEYVINSPVNISGGAGNDTVRIIGTEFSDKFVITAGGIFGAGLTVNYVEIEVLEVDGAEGNDEFFVLSTNPLVETRLYGGSGHDRFYLGGDVPNVYSGSQVIFPATAGPHTVANIGTNTLLVDGAGGSGSTGGLGTPVMLPGETNALPSVGSVLAYTGTGTALSVDTIRIDSTGLAGAGFPVVADLVGKTLEISFGPGLDRFWLITAVAAGPNPNSLNLTLLSPTTPAPEWGLPTTQSQFAISHLSTNFFVNESTSIDSLFVFNDAATADQSGQLSATALTGLGMATGVTYQNLESLEVFLGTGNDTVNVLSTMKRDDGFRTITVLNTGPGNDTVNISLSALTDGFFAVNTEAGDDRVLAAASTLPLVIFGGQGNDEIQGGQGNDIIFGDDGRVDYRNASGRLVTRLGLGLAERHLLLPGEVESSVLDQPYLVSDGAALPPSQETTRGITGGNDTIIGNLGSDNIFGGPGADRISGDALVSGANDGSDIIFGDNGQVLLANGLVTTIETLDPTVGEGDVISTGNGNNIVFGGVGGDSINAGSGDDVIFGDYGKVTRSSNLFVSITSTDPSIGGDDTILGGLGRDWIIGGPGSDRIWGDGLTSTPGDGADVIFGDNGRILFAAGVITLIETLSAAVGSGDIIDTGNGDNIVFGGAGGDSINAGAGNDVLFGDHGRILRANNLFVSIASIDPALGGDDTIVGGLGRDYIFGGTGADRIWGDGLTSTTGDGADVIFGDNGRILFTSGLPSTIETTDPAIGGNDTIEAGAGNDTALGGAGDDVINGADGDDVLIGDHAQIQLASSLLVQIITNAPTFGGNDTITGGLGRDIIFGGVGSDWILGDAPATASVPGGVSPAAPSPIGGLPGAPANSGANGDIIFGDTGQINFVSGLASVIVADDAVFGGPDTISGGDGNDTILGGMGSDLIAGDAGADIIFGDLGRLEPRPNNTFAYLTLQPSAGGDDTITGGAGSDIVFGGYGRDWIEGGADNDYIVGDSGLIIISLGFVSSLSTTDLLLGGSDTVTGGDGNDVIVGGAAGDSLSGNNGRDYIVGDSASITFVGGIPININSSDLLGGGNDTLSGGMGDDVIFGGAFSDLIDAGEGDDVIAGDNGFANLAQGLVTQFQTTNTSIGDNDTIMAGGGRDVVFGGRGADLIYGDAGNDVLLGDFGLAQFSQGSVVNTRTTDVGFGDNDTIIGGDGDDVVLGGHGGDSIMGSAGDDVLLGDYGVVVFSGVSLVSVDSTDPAAGGDDFLSGGLGRDVLIGGFGNDRLQGDADADILFGDSASIAYSQNKPVQVMSIEPGVGGNDSIIAGAGDDLAFGGAGADLITGEQGDDILSGDSGRATLSQWIVTTVATTDTSTGGNDTISGGDGDDVIFGGFGRDLIQGDAGSDTLLGDFGSAQFSSGVITSVAADTPAAGDNDTILGGAGDDLILGGAGSDSISGGLGDDVILGDFGTVLFSQGQISSVATTFPTFGAGDMIDGDEGADLIVAGAGNDTVDGGAGNDIIVGDFASVTLSKGNVVTLTSTDANLGGNDSLAGGAGDDLIIGGFGNDRASGGTGNDIIVGDSAQLTAGSGNIKSIATIQPNLGGNDTLQGDVGDDFLIGGAGDDWISGGFGNDSILGDNGSLVAKMTSPSVLYGAVLTATDPTIGGKDALAGDEGNDIIIGGDDNDTISGGAGNDLLFGDHAQADVPFPAYGSPTFASLFPTVGGNDSIRGGAGNDTVYGGAGDDLLYGEGDNDYLHVGNTGNAPDNGYDRAYGGMGTDSLESGFASAIPASAHPAFTNQISTDFSSGVPALVSAKSGLWSLQSGRYQGSAAGTTTAVSTITNSLLSSTYVEYQETIKTSVMGGLVFDYKGPTDFKFAAVDLRTNQLIIGHRTAAGFVNDAVITRSLSAASDQLLGISLQGKVVKLFVNGVAGPTFTFSSAVFSGQLGMLSSGGASLFDNLRIRTDDPVAGGFNQLAAGAPKTGSTAALLTQAELAPIVNEAIARWTSVVGTERAAQLREVPLSISNLPGRSLGLTLDGTIFIDTNAAGFGWFIDATPHLDEEFQVRPGASQASTRTGALRDRMDLLTVVMHEFGHVLEASSALPSSSRRLMNETIAPGVRRTPSGGLIPSGPQLVKSSRHVIAGDNSTRLLAATMRATQNLGRKQPQRANEGGMSSRIHTNSSLVLTSLSKVRHAHVDRAIDLLSKRRAD